jgi:hypothetical protein
MDRKSRTFFVLILLILLSVMSITPAAGAPARQEELPDLFSEGSAVQPRSAAAQTPEVIRAREASVDFGLIQALARSGSQASQPAFILNFFDDASFVVHLTSVRDLGNGTLSLIGVVDSPEYSEMVIVSREGILQGYLQIGNRSFEVRYHGQGHTLAEVDPELYPESLPAVAPDAGGESFDLSAGDQTLPAADTGETIDVLAVYTAGARDQLGGVGAIETRILQSIESTNAGYSASGVVQRVRLVGMELVSYNEYASVPTISGLTQETSRWQYALYRLQDGSYGSDPAGANYLADARAYRDLYGADLVFMITDLPYIYCGLGFLAGDDWATEYGFSIVHRNCSGSSSYTTQHEMGHNMGACHDYDNTHPDTRPYCWDSYSYGYQLDYEFYTVMAYSAGCINCSRINRWSNPNLTYNGYPTGLTLANNARTLNETAYNVANYRGAVVSPVSGSFLTPAAGGQVMIPRDTLSVTASSTAGSIQSVQFQAFYSGSWHVLGTDNSSADGWSVFWQTVGISQQSINLRAVVTDAAANQATIELNDILLSRTQTSIYGYTSKGGGGSDQEGEQGGLAWDSEMVEEDVGRVGPVVSHDLAVPAAAKPFGYGPVGRWRMA